MPRKVFVAGEILTASDVNTNLMDQAVMVFDDATARATAIPTPVEGMVTYLKDTDRVDKFDGTDFVNVDTGGLIAVKSAIRDTIFDVSVGAAGSASVPGLSITHAVSDPANRLIISAFIGTAANSEGRAQTGLAVHDGSGIIDGPAAPGARAQVHAGARIAQVGADQQGTTLAVTFVHTPGAGSKTYTVRVVNIDSGTRTLFVNRVERNTDSSFLPNSVSSLVIQEVAV